MYSYTDFDERFVRARIDEFRGQVARRLDGSLTEDEFKPLRLMNGLYLQLHAYMLRVAIPYGTLNARQMRQLAYIADRWDKGYGHFTTRQNIQFNWPKLHDVPAMLDALADVHMHAIQTSGNCIRNVTAGHFAGATPDEVEDPRITAELIRQWSTDHPEFAYLPRKFKVAVTGSDKDRAVLRFHDIGLRLRKVADEIGYEVVIGGGMGRTPMIGKTVRDFLPKKDLLAYLEAILRTYNLSGRRDNKYKARIKILVHETGLEELKARIDENFAQQKRVLPDVAPDVVARIAGDFLDPVFKTDPVQQLTFSPALQAFIDTNVTPHKRADHVSVTISTKATGATPGDVTSGQLLVLGDLAERFGYDELRISHEQNVILPHVHRNDLPAVYEKLQLAGLATANVGLISDIIACPGMDYCALATARSIPIAQQIGETFADLDAQHDIGPLKIKISGCINACGHHHVGHIGILGLDRAGVESYQLTLGGDGTEEATIGTRTGPGFAYDEVVPAVERLIKAYLALRHGPEETFLAAYRRLGIAPFRAALYEVRDAAA
ncbi:nitrite/sulfite reductase [Lutimaribacter saemankumensis]|uniref:Sulfite reductase (NADPH) hemoprotein beta-component n=1 Tax=Lutimaribacter saemankumensis TaxID=490829 RepID=A0A1G8THA6_9RHOB|nr:nitrite/sulfite reductase [Lutimaribacter saemankumensis]SDJ40966.1 sulfite reductase (NADPH) hemoprotein beta-component [Lutimaribacter saemankumensis]